MSETGKRLLEAAREMSALGFSAPSLTAEVCSCVGPRDGEPLCPCQMRGVEIKGDRYVIPERDLGPVARRHPNQETPWSKSVRSHPLPPKETT